jgi:muramidase (phage lysozyme)
MDARAVIFIALAGFAGVALAMRPARRVGAGAASFADGGITAEGPDPYAPPDDWGPLPVFQDAAAYVEASISEVFGVTMPDAYEQANERAFLRTIIAAEGTDKEADPYRVVFGYGHTLQDLSEHPAVTGEWRGAAFGNGRWSTAAGAFQIIKPTWLGVRDRLSLPDFTPASQDAAALELIRKRGALADVRAGRFVSAVNKVRKEWASMPGAGYGQGERTIEWVAAKYQQAGGQFA